MLKKSVKLMISTMMCMALAIGVGVDSGATKQVQAATTFAKGADIGWLNQLENQGVKWQNDNGVQTDALQILKDHGINSIRLRVFVNPPSDFKWTKNDGTNTILGYGDTNGVVYTAQRAKKLGMRIMIDFHYSDHFADPAYQDKPAAWVGHSFSQLQTDVYSHTSYVMNALKNAGVTPEWVQVGNETNSGMLWPDGSSSNFTNWAALINQGYNAIKAVSPSSKVILHLSNGANNSLYRSVFDGLTKAGAKFDVIGMSYYPYWDGVDYTKNIDALGSNMNDMVSRYNKEVMICEIGGLETNPTNSYNMIKAAISKVQAVPNGKGLGVFYWEPEANSSVLPDKYPLGATTKTSTNVLKFSTALDAFK
jgi:arabinogalactan endo-1,4-beta-galactosidase